MKCMMFNVTESLTAVLDGWTPAVDGLGLRMLVMHALHVAMGI